jgi:hypothetical protein
MRTFVRTVIAGRAGPWDRFPWLLVALVFASRLPYLRPGYGTDPDAYRVIAAARVLRSGAYSASRLPGYPLHEVATALLLPGGPRLVNGATALMSALAALGLFRLAERLGLDRQRATWLLLAFAFTPVVYQNSTSSIDYVWSICFALWSAAQLAVGRAWLAGLLLGAAVGARITAGGMLLPLLVLNAGLSLGGERYARAARLCLSTAAVSALCFAPVFYAHGSTFFRYDDASATPFGEVLERASVEVWGSFGVYAWCGVLTLAACASRPLLAAWSCSRTRLAVLTSGVALLVFGVAFLLLPHEPAYLIPCVPFALLIVAFSLPTLAIAELALLLLISCFVALGPEGLSTDGPVPQERAQRIAQVTATNRVVRRVAAMPGKALIVAGPMLPWIEEKIGGTQQGPHLYLYILQSEQDLADYVRRGYALYYVHPGIERMQRRLVGIALRAHGASSLL